MKISVDGRALSEGDHKSKTILIDTMILCYAHDMISPHNPKASIITKAAVMGLINAHLTYQNLAEFYSVITGKRVKRPISPGSAANLCRLYQECANIKFLLPTEQTYTDALKTAEAQQMEGGDIFGSILAHTAKGKVDTIWTDNTKHFESYPFLKAENPLKWKWEEAD
jgi:predicted nucleic acid-binding protein